MSFSLFRRRHGTAGQTTKSEELPSSRPTSSLRQRMSRLSRRAKVKTRKHATASNAEEELRDQPPSSTIRTSILGSYEPPAVGKEENDGRNCFVDRDDENTELVAGESYSATAILQHMFVMCGRLDDVNDNHDRKTTFRPRLSEDPTVQESFECVFSSQLEQGLEHEGLWEEDELSAIPKSPTLMSPALLHQTLGSSRRQMTASLPSTLSTKPRKTFRTGSLVHIGTYDPLNDSLITSVPKNLAQQRKAGVQAPVVCRCCSGTIAPRLSPEQWPQRPLLFRPTPRSGMKVKGVRFVNSKNYLWKAGDTEHTWLQSLHRHWGREVPMVDLGCIECMILPINNGNEPENESLVVDFLSDLFEGTVLLRLRHSNGSTREPYDDSTGYFAGVNRRYQVVIQGRPLKELSMNDLMTGFQLEHPCGKLPPKWILNSAIKFMSFFAPQMHTNLEGPKPMSISPLGSTPQLVRVNGDLGIEPKQEEPSVKEETLLGVASNAASTLARAKFRKKAFDKLFASRSPGTPSLKPENTYTFEFLQHLLNFTDFKVELGSMLGSIPLKDVLNGQALPIMACTPTQRLWSFDVLHEDLMEDTLRLDSLIL